MALVDIQNLHVKFHVGHDTVYALRGVYLQVERGARTAIVGESGSGKTVTATSMLRLLPPTARITEGRILFQGADLLALSENELRPIRGSQICMVFQNASAALNPLYPVGQQIADVYRQHNGGNKREAWQRAVEVLAATGIPHPEDRARNYPFEYSGGMAQRAMIAMALVCSPQLLIADEPTSGLDVTIQVQVLDLIQEVVEKLDATLMLITHDIGLVSAVCDRVAVMYAGTVMETGSVSQVLGRPANPYTIRLLECFASTSGEKMPFIPGRVPDLREQWQGCSFAERCPRAQDICGREAPAVREVETGHYSACHFS
ncbi:MAG: ABC transporter ATP-binding protein [Anaerolineae bacterium]|nr:ABC transporter ATP-binding protein [Anaerolineae bacterium]